MRGIEDHGVPVCLLSPPSLASSPSHMHARSSEQSPLVEVLLIRVSIDMTHHDDQTARQYGYSLSQATKSAPRAPAAYAFSVGVLSVEYDYI